MCGHHPFSMTVFPQPFPKVSQHCPFLSRDFAEIR